MALCLFDRHICACIYIYIFKERYRYGKYTDTSHIRRIRSQADSKVAGLKKDTLTFGGASSFTTKSPVGPLETLELRWRAPAGFLRPRGFGATGYPKGWRRNVTSCNFPAVYILYYTLKHTKKIEMAINCLDIHVKKIRHVKTHVMETFSNKSPKFPPNCSYHTKSPTMPIPQRDSTTDESCSYATKPRREEPGNATVKERSTAAEETSKSTRGACKYRRHSRTIT